MPESRTIPPVSVEPEVAVPPRFRRLKIHATFAFVLMLALLGVRWWWASAAEARMKAVIEAAHARGERIVREDYEETVISDNLNAAAVVRDAATRISLTQDQEIWDGDFEGKLPLNRTDVDYIAQILTTHRSALEEARRARGISDVGLIVRLAKPSYLTVLGHLNPCRHLVEVLAKAALYEHTIGDDADALERIFDGIRIGDAMTEAAPARVSFLVQVGMYRRNCELLIDLAPTLDVKDSATPAATTRPAVRQQVSDLIAKLLDERAMREAARQAWHGERLMALDSAPAMASGFGGRWFGWLSEPLLTLDATRLAQTYHSFANAATQPTFPAAVAAVARPMDTRQISQLQRMTMMVTADLALDAKRTLTSHFTVMLERRAAATLLAMRLYALDHGGELPPTLDALAPAYLPAVPRDPFAANDQPLAYRSAPAATQPFIYSIGSDGIDGGGSRAPLNRKVQPTRAWNRWELEDVVYFIEPAMTRGSTQPVIENPPPPEFQSE